MSDDWLHIIPVEAGYLPDEHQMQSAASVLALAWARFHPKTVRTEREDWSPRIGEIVLQLILREEIQFLGGPPGDILCPYCTAVLDDEWWGNAMNRSYDTKFRNLLVSTPCCNREAHLDALIYEVPIGFAQFSISVLNPIRRVGKKIREGPGFWTKIRELPLKAETLSRIGAKLGCEVRKVWVHV